VIRSVALLAGLALLAPASSPAQEKKGSPRPELRSAVKQWTAVNADTKLQDAAKPGQVITDAETFAKVWEAWNGKEAVPEVDFKTQVVVVWTSEYELYKMSLYGGSDKWRSSVSNKSPKKIKGFSWAIGVFDLKGVKEISGVKFGEQDKEKPKDK
jgi:hypothetical protein